MSVVSDRDGFIRGALARSLERCRRSRSFRERIAHARAYARYESDTGRDIYARRRTLMYRERTSMRAYLPVYKRKTRERIPSRERKVPPVAAARCDGLSKKERDGAI